MASNPVKPFALTTSPPAGSSVAFLATIDFNGQTVPINTGDVTQGLSNLVFSLSNPVEIGPISAFFDFLHNSIGVPLTSADVQNAIDMIPTTPTALGEIRNALTAIFTTPLSITALNVNVKAGSFMLGVSMPINLQVTSFLTINNIGVVVNKVGAVGSP